MNNFLRTASLLIAIVIFKQDFFSANRYWVAGATGNWNNTLNWSTTNGGAGGASVPGVADVAIFNANGLGNCNVDVAVSIGGLTVNGYTAIIDLSGFSFTSTGTVNLASGTINDTPGTSSLTINSAGTSTFSGTTFGCIVNATSARILLNGSTFNTTANFIKNGGGNDNGAGGNTFNGVTSIDNQGTGRLRLSNTTADTFNANVTLTSSGSSVLQLAHNGAATAFNGNILINSLGTSNGIEFGQGTESATLANSMTISVGGSGFSVGTFEPRNFTQIGGTPQSITLTGTAVADLEANCIWNGNLSLSAPRIYLENNIFNGTVSFTKTGTGNDSNFGGNTFNSTSTIINNGSGHIYFANNSADTFSNDLTLIVSNTGRIFLAHSANGNLFNGNIFINYITNTNIYIGNNSGTSTLANGKTISVIGAGASGCGNLYLEEFTQLGTTVQAISLNGSGLLSIGPNSTFNADLFTSSPGLYLRESVFNGITSFDKTGSSGNTSYGGNTYNDTISITNSGSNYLRLAGTLGNTYNEVAIFSSTGSSVVEPSRVGSSSFNENIVVNSAGSSTGIYFGNGGGSPTLATTKTVTVGSSGFSIGQLRFRNFTQLGNTPQSLTLTGTALLYNYDSNWGGTVNFIAPRNITRGTTYNQVCYLEKTGATNDQSVGGNTFMQDVSFVNSGTGYLMIGNGTLDVYSGNVTLTNSGTRHLYFAQNGAGHTIAGDLTVNNITADTSDFIYIANASGASLTVNGNTVINNNVTGVDGRVYVGNQGDITFNGTIELNNTATGTNSEIYCNLGTNSNNIYNENITINSTSGSGIRFGQNGGSGTLAATKTIAIGISGFSAGELRLRNFTQIGNTPQSLTLTGTGYLYNYDSNWGGDVTFIAPRNNSRGTAYSRTAYLEKTGATNDASAGGNTFTMDVDIVNSGSGYFMFGNGTFDTFSSDVTLSNTGNSHIYFAYNGAGHTVAGNLSGTNSGTGAGTRGIYIASQASSTLNINGNVTLTQNGNGTALRSYIGDQGDVTINGNLTITNSGAGTTSDMRIANNTNSSVSIAGSTTITNNSNATTTNRIYLGNQGDITFNNTLDIINNANTANSEVFCNYNTNSSNTYNDDVTVASTVANCDGVRFGQNGGSSTLATTKTITIGVGGFISGELRFRNFVQLGATPQSLTLTGSALLRFREGNVFNGNLTTVSPRLYTEGGTFNGTTSLTKNGNYHDYPRGGCTFNGVTTITNSSANRLRMSNQAAYVDDFNNDVTFIRSGTGTLEVARNGVNTFAGDININGASVITFGQGGGTALFDGSNSQNISDALGSSVNPDFYRLEMNKSSNHLTLNMPINVRTTLTLTNGNINTTNTNLLTMFDNSTVGAVSNSSYVRGPIEKIGNDAFTFPVGDSSYYRPISISAPSNNTHSFRAEYIEVDPHPTYDENLKDLTIDHISSCEYWLLDRINGTSNVSVTLSWDANSCGVNSLPDLKIARWNGAQWKDHGNGGTTGNNSAGTVLSSTAISNFSPFTLASRNSLNPLPIELIEFNAELNNDYVDINWTTSSEINNDYYTLEKSKDGINWVAFAEQPGAGNSNTILYYSEIDYQPYSGVSYYRLKQTDFDGAFEYSRIVSVNNEDNDISTYPNPVKNILTIDGLNDNDQISVISIDGREIYTGNSSKINTSTWSSGIYNLIIRDNNGKIRDTIKVVK